MGKSTCPLEHAEQVTFVNEFEKAWPDVWLFAVPNGGFRHKATADKLKAEGLRPGVPDIVIPEWHVYIEMKRQKGGRLSDDQAKWLGYLAECGYTCIVAKGWEDAFKQLADAGYKADGF